MDRFGMRHPGTLPPQSRRTDLETEPPRVGNDTPSGGPVTVSQDNNSSLEDRAAIEDPQVRLLANASAAPLEAPVSEFRKQLQAAQTGKIETADAKVSEFRKQLQDAQTGKIEAADAKISEFRKQLQDVQTGKIETADAKISEFRKQVQDVQTGKIEAADAKVSEFRIQLQDALAGKIEAADAKLSEFRIQLKKESEISRVRMAVLEDKRIVNEALPDDPDPKNPAPLLASIPLPPPNKPFRLKTFIGKIINVAVETVSNITSNLGGLITKSKLRIGEVETVVDRDDGISHKRLTELAKGLGDMPPSVHESVHRVGLHSTENPDDAFWRKQFGNPNFKSAGTGGAGGMDFWGGFYSDGILLHEGAHTYAAEVFGNVAPKAGNATSKQWESAILADKTFPSGYARSVYENPNGCSDGEDFAEAFRMFIQAKRAGPQALAQFNDQFPHRAAFLMREFNAEI